MQQAKFRNLAIAALILTFGALASRGVVADEVNAWDGQWHVNATAYGWTPFMYTTVQLPDIAGGGNPTIETQPSQYLKYLNSGILLDGTVRKGDWALWTDLVYLNLQANQEHTHQIGLPGGDPLVPVDKTLDVGLRAAIWTLAPTYTVMNNDVGTLDVLAGLRYISTKVSIAYQLTAGPIQRGGGFWPTGNLTDGIVGVTGALRLSSDGKWFVPYEADVGDGNKNWQWNAFVGGGYHFRWGDVVLGCRNLTVNRTGDVSIEKVRMTGPLLGATFHW